MKMTRNTLLAAGALATLLVTTGCGPQAKTMPNGDGKPTGKSGASATVNSNAANSSTIKIDTAPADRVTINTKPTGESKSAPSAPANPPVTSTGAPEKVLLGSPELTAGIPG